MTPCMLWTGSVGTHGYGVMQYGGQQVLAHRVAYARANGVGVLSMGGTVLHSCDVRLCVNPDHLSLGTQGDNMHDAACKGRVSHGEAHTHAALTEEAVRTIRRVYVPRHREFGCRGLARKYGVSHTVVSDVVLSKSWGHVNA